MIACRSAALAMVLTPMVWAQGEPDPKVWYAKITSPDVQPRCFAGPRSPVYDDVLTEGSVVKVGEVVGEYRRLLLPLGVTGYVHKKFTTEPQEGLVGSEDEAVVGYFLVKAESYDAALDLARDCPSLAVSRLEIREALEM